MIEPFAIGPWLEALVRHAAAAVPDRAEPDLETWWRASGAWCEGPSAPPIAAATLRAVHADRLGFAFAAGYAAALERLLPALGGRRASLCVTEDGGNRPRAIGTTLQRDATHTLRLDGHKRWATLGHRAEVLLVAARAGTRADGRPELCLVQVARDAPGVLLAPLAPTPFAPEIGHAAVTFDGVPVAESDVLLGDGWDAWVKPFRTIEDIHVQAATTAFLLGVALRAGWPRAAALELTALLVALAGLAGADPASPGTHLALAGCATALAGWLERHEARWATVDGDVRARWERDRALLSVASRAGAARLERAWDALSPPPAATSPGDR